MPDYEKLCEDLRDDEMTCNVCDRQTECNGEPGCLIRHAAADAIEALQAELDSAMAKQKIKVEQKVVRSSFGGETTDRLSELLLEGYYVKAITPIIHERYLYIEYIVEREKETANG